MRRTLVVGLVSLCACASAACDAGSVNIGDNVPLTRDVGPNEAGSRFVGGSDATTADAFDASIDAIDENNAPSDALVVLDTSDGAIVQNDLGLGVDAPNDPAHAVTPPVTSGAGQLTADDPVDCYKFHGNMNTTLRICMSFNAAVSGTTFTKIGFEVTDPNGIIEQHGGASTCAVVPATLTGDYTVCLSNGSGFVTGGSGWGPYTFSFAVL